MKEKISTKGQACLKPKVDIFYFNNSQSYPKSASAQKKNEVFPKVFGEAFFKKLRYTLSASASKEVEFAQGIARFVFYDAGENIGCIVPAV